MQEPLNASYPVLPLRDIVVFPHMIVPLFVGREKSVKALEEVMAGLEGPVILSGDFNMMPWGHSVRRLTRAADVRRAGPLQPTYWLAPHGWPAGQALPIPLALDQVWAPGGGRAETRPLWGSDHAGVLARVHLDAD